MAHDVEKQTREKPKRKLNGTEGHTNGVRVEGKKVTAWWWPATQSHRRVTGAYAE